MNINITTTKLADGYECEWSFDGLTQHGGLGRAQAPTMGGAQRNAYVAALQCLTRLVGEEGFTHYSNLHFIYH